MNKLLAAMVLLSIASADALAGNNLVMNNVTNNRKVNNAYTYTPGGAANASRNLTYMRGTSGYSATQTTYNNQMNYLRSSSMSTQVAQGYRIFGGGAIKTKP